MIGNCRKKLIISAAVLWAGVFLICSGAQAGVAEIRAARQTLESASAQVESLKKEVSDLEDLFAADAVTGRELKTAQNNLADAKSKVEQSRIGLESAFFQSLAGALGISVLDALWEFDAQGESRIKITVLNSSSLYEAENYLSAAGGCAPMKENELPGALALRNVNLSLEGSGGAAASPDQLFFDRILFGEQLEAVFRLGAGVEKPALLARFDGGFVRIPINVQPPFKPGMVKMLADQKEKETRPGGETVFDLTFTCAGSGPVGGELKVFNLPPGFSSEFLTGGQSVNRLFLDPKKPSTEAQLKVKPLPTGEETATEESIDFIAAFIPVPALDKAPSETGRTLVKPEDLDVIGVPFVELSLNPRPGVELELALPRSPVEWKDSGKASMEMDIIVKNPGNVPVVFGSIESEAPRGFGAKLKKSGNDVINPGREITVKMVIEKLVPTEIGTVNFVFQAIGAVEQREVRSNRKIVQVIINPAPDLKSPETGRGKQTREPGGFYSPGNLELALIVLLFGNIALLILLLYKKRRRGKRGKVPPETIAE